MRISVPSIFLLLPSLFAARIFNTEKDVVQYLKNIYERNSNMRCVRFKSALWNAETDSNDTTKRELFNNISLVQAQAIRNEWVEHFKDLSPKQNRSANIKRQLGFVKNVGLHSLEEKDFKNITSIIKNMTVTDKSVKICPFNKKKCSTFEMLSLEPILKNRMMHQSTNTEELQYIWTSWRDLIASDVKKQFLKFVELSNKAANLNGFRDTGQMWRSEYESPSFYEQVDDLWDDVRPLYNELHKYVLKNMKTIYNGHLDFDDGLMPAHVIGDMWASDWTHLSNILKPFPKSYSVNVTKELINQNYYAIDMYRTANSFYTSMGLSTNEMAYDSYSMIEKPVRRSVECRAENFDFCDGRHYRMKACSNLTQADFFEIHSQMLEVQYFQQYKNQPYAFRSSANPAFSKAIGGAVALSAISPNYLSKVGLLIDYKNTYGSAMNRLMDGALKDIASLPYNLMVDKWRWDVFSGAVNDKWYRQWWKYREYYQKIKPPTPRDNDKFDPGAQFYLVGGLTSIDQFIATILQFQIYKAFCIKSGQYDPKSKTPALNRCDFSGSREVGNILRSSLQLGRSKHWKNVLKEISNDNDLDAAALLEYFEPLYDYLKNMNKIHRASSSTKKPSKKKKKKKKHHKTENRQRKVVPLQFQDFDEDDFEEDDEDFHDTVDTDFMTSTSLNSFEAEDATTKDPINISNNTSKKLGPMANTSSSANQNTIAATVTKAFDNVTNSTILDDSTERIEENIMHSETSEGSNNTSSIKDQTIDEISTNVDTSPITSEGVGASSSVKSTSKNYSIDFVFRRNSSTIPTVQVDMVTFAEVDRNETTSSRGAITNFECISLLLLLVLYKLR